MLDETLAKLDDEALLKTRICALGLSIQNTYLENCINQLNKELADKGLLFHPPCYLADEWLCPDGEPIIGIPFYLAHPRLKQLEKKMVLEVEGETIKECMKLLRHECGHAYNYAYKLHKKKKWCKTFGSFSEEYPDTYIPRPYSKKYVRHIENCYAQYHPDEDFAETFAVWLTPDENWRERYKFWPAALAKLEYVGLLMNQIVGKDPIYTCHKKYWSADKLRQTLDYYYKKKRREYAENLPGFFDPDLKRIFREVGTSKVQESAVKFIRRYRKKIVGSVGVWTGKNKYLVNELLGRLIEAARALDLGRYTEEDETLLDITAYVNTIVMNYLFTGRLKQCP